MNDLTPEEILLFRSMPPEQKLALVDRFYRDARSLKCAALKTFHPEWSDLDIEKKCTELFLYGTD